MTAGAAPSPTRTPVVPSIADAGTGLEAASALVVGTLVGAVVWLLIISAIGWL